MVTFYFTFFFIFIFSYDVLFYILLIYYNINKFFNFILYIFSLIIQGVPF